MVCQIETQWLRTGPSGGLELRLSEPQGRQQFWRCVLREGQVEVDRGSGLVPVSSRLALKGLIQALLLRSALEAGAGDGADLSQDGALL